MMNELKEVTRRGWTVSIETGFRKDYLIIISRVNSPDCGDIKIGIYADGDGRPGSHCQVEIQFEEYSDIINEKVSEIWKYVMFFREELNKLVKDSGK